MGRLDIFVHASHLCIPQNVTIDISFRKVCLGLPKRLRLTLRFDAGFQHDLEQFSSRDVRSSVIYWSIASTMLRVSLLFGSHVTFFFYDKVEASLIRNVLRLSLRFDYADCGTTMSKCWCTCELRQLIDEVREPHFNPSTNSLMFTFCVQNMWAAVRLRDTAFSTKDHTYTRLSRTRHSFVVQDCTFTYYR